MNFLILTLVGLIAQAEGPAIVAPSPEATVEKPVEKTAEKIEGDSEARKVILTQEKLLKGYDAEKLQAAANFLRARADVEKMDKKEANRFCSISPDEARRQLTALKPLMDLKVRETALARSSFRAQAKNPDHTNISESRWRKCVKTCTCGVYQDILESVDDTQRTETDRLTLEWLTKEAAGLKSDAVMACTKKVRWFCQSPLHRHLKAEAKQLKTEGM